ncbi:MAG: hypothetical protein Kow0063_44940 [Anaerolineae bacterium]
MASRQDEEALSAQLEEGALDAIMARLQRVFPRLVEHQPVRLAYLYGSVATGRTMPFSDVDIALLVDDDLSPAERLNLILRLQLDLADQAGISKADVRIINDAPLVFRGRVVTDGLLVYARDEQERVEFETTTRMRYFDYQPVHKRLQDAFFADLRERGLYGRSGQG